MTDKNTTDKEINISDNEGEVNIGNVISGNVQGDVAAGDKVGGDKVAGDKITYHPETAFDQRGQQVGTQYNVGWDINVNQSPEPGPGPPNTDFWKIAVSAGIIITVVAGLVAIASDSLNVFNFLISSPATTEPVIELRQSQEDALQNYLDDMSDLLIRENLQNAEPGTAPSACRIALHHPVGIT